MTSRIIAVFCLIASPLLGAVPQKKQAAPASKATAPDIEKELVTYLGHFLPFNPDSQITIEKAPSPLTGFQGFKAHRKGHFEKLNVDRVVYVSDDGHWFFAGDTMVNSNPRPVRGPADVAWLEAKFSDLFHSKLHVELTPEKDAAGLKAVAIVVDTGYFPVHMPGYVTADGKQFLQGTLWDFRLDPRAEKRRRIDLSANRASGPADASVQAVEYADMECAYCKYRGLQMDKLLEVNTGIVKLRRHYKFFPLWLSHVWSMKAASAADCIFRFAPGPAMFRFKEAVYGRQESLTVAGIDELAITTAEAEGVSTADFLSCYLRDDSFAHVKKDIEEGYRLGVNSTPTYFIDGVEISWVEDKVMEDFLRTLFPNTKTIDYTR